MTHDDLWKTRLSNGDRLIDGVYKCKYFQVPADYINIFSEELGESDDLFIFSRSRNLTKSNQQSFYCKYSIDINYEKVKECIESRSKIPTTQINSDNQQYHL